jgi:hypothetical protein
MRLTNLNSTSALSPTLKSDTQKTNKHTDNCNTIKTGKIAVFLKTFAWGIYRSIYQIIYMLKSLPYLSIDLLR